MQIIFPSEALCSAAGKLKELWQQQIVSHRVAAIRTSTVMMLTIPRPMHYVFMLYQGSAGWCGFVVLS